MADRKIRRALISVYDKTGIEELCQTLASLEVGILSSGGTASLLEKRGIAVTRVADYTGFPEMLDGRVKTLHPKIHAGILFVVCYSNNQRNIIKAYRPELPVGRGALGEIAVLATLDHRLLVVEHQLRDEQACEAPRILVHSPVWC